MIVICTPVILIFVIVNINKNIKYYIKINITEFLLFMNPYLDSYVHVLNVRLLYVTTTFFIFL